MLSGAGRLPDFRQVIFGSDTTAGDAVKLRSRSPAAHYNLSMAYNLPDERRGLRIRYSSANDGEGGRQVGFAAGNSA